MKASLKNYRPLIALAAFSLLALTGCPLFRAAGDTAEAVGEGAGHVVTETGRGVGSAVEGTGDAIGGAVR